MATSNKLLGQVAPAPAGASSILYTTPAATNAVISAVVVAEVTGVACTFTLAIVSGASTTSATPTQFLVGGPTTGQSIGASATVVYTLGITMGPSEWLIVRQPTATTAQLNVNCFGTEIT